MSLLVTYNSYLQSVVGHSTSSIPHNTREATHYTLQYRKFNQWYVQQEDYTPLSSSRSLPFFYNMTRYETRICPFDIELQYHLYALRNDTYHLLEANVTKIIEISWSGDPNITLGQMIAYILLFLIAPSVLITFAIYQIGRKYARVQSASQLFAIKKRRYCGRCRQQGWSANPTPLYTNMSNTSIDPSVGLARAYNTFFEIVSDI
jgi:hypothetical protein